MWLDGDWADLAYVKEGESPTKWNRNKHDYPGVYRLVALSDRNARCPAVLHRLCGNDDTGTLYIGQASVLHPRLSMLIRSVDPGYKAEGYPAFAEGLSRLYPVEQLAATWQRLESAGDALAREGYLLRNYVAQFGERPPRNGQGGLG